MGCCQDSKVRALNNNVFSEKLKEAIDSGSVKRINMLIDILNKKKKKEGLFINKEIVSIGQYSLNPLAYCALLGNYKMFKHLIDKGASLKIMEDQLESQNLRAINMICYKGHLNLLKVYLPLYLKSNRESFCSQRSYTIDFSDQNNLPFYDLPIHSACRAGMIQIVSFIYQHFSSGPAVPREFDIHAVDEGFGEDAGLIACRVGSFPLVKYLHEHCGVSFKKLNTNKENAIMICVCGDKKSPNFSYLECLSYLVEIVKLDITYMYEEVLIMAESQAIIAYLESQLIKVGIFVKKEDVDKDFIVRRTRVESNISTNEVFVDGLKKENEIFFDQFRKDNAIDKSLLSSIASENKSRVGTSWAESFEPFIMK